MSDDNGRSGCESATAYADTGGPLTLAEIDDRLTEFGICESDDDRDRGDAEEISAPGSWQWADRQICRYVAGMVDGWRTDQVGGRNPWLYSQGIRLASAWRYGCFTADGYRDAETALIERFRALCATQEPRRAVRRYEEHDVLYRACKRAAAKTDEQVAAELGQHPLLSHITLEQFVKDGEAEPEPPKGDEDGSSTPPNDEPPKDQPPNDNDDAWAKAVRQRALQIRLDRDARQLVDDESRPPIIYPPIRSLDTLLAEPDNPTQYRIEGVAPAGGRVMLSSQYKAGKTTVVGNLMRSLVDSDPFLGRFAVHQSARNLVLIDDELSDHTVRLWLREQGIVNTAAVADVITLRGNVAAFNLLDDKCRDQWTTRLRDLGCDYLILDCLRPILDALGLDEHRDVGRFLVPFDALLAEAGIPDSLMVQHMGHANERARGDSRLQDWPDAIWRIVRETDEPDSARFFSAYGRDVNVHEGRLAFDPVARRLTYAAGSRGDAKTEAALHMVITMLACDLGEVTGGLSANTIETEGAEHSRKSIRAAIKLAEARGLITITAGPRNAKLHRIANPCAACGYPMTAGQTGRHLNCARWDDADEATP